MRLFRSLPLLLALVVAPMALADDLYQVEMILVRQNAEPQIISRAAPEDWAAGAQRLGPDSQRTPALGGIVEKLGASGNYSVLLHRAWQQNLGKPRSRSPSATGPSSLASSPSRAPWA